jgi:hypothetical protein
LVDRCCAKVPFSFSFLPSFTPGLGEFDKTIELQFLLVFIIHVSLAKLESNSVFKMDCYSEICIEESSLTSSEGMNGKAGHVFCLF